MRLPEIDSLPRNSRPVYQQIADHLRDEIEQGELDSGERLPTIRALAADLGVNRDTVSLAYDLLAGEGLVHSTVGRGTFVSDPTAPAGEGEGRATLLAPEVESLIRFEHARPRITAVEGVEPLHSLIPDPALYPVDAFRRCLNRVLTRGGPELFLYGGPQGHPGLRDCLASRLAADGGVCTGDDIVLCHGASQGIGLAIRLFAGSGETVAVESPTYHNVLGTLVGLGLQAAPVPMGSDGPDLDALDRTLARPDVKAFYTIPTFHNPMGTTMSLAGRRALLEIAGRHGKPVIEDAFEMDLRFSGRNVASLFALDEHDLVVQLSSFSKSLFPGVRIGALAARGRAVEGLVALKHATDLSDSLPLQAAMEAFVSDGSYDRHLTRLRRILRKRRDVMLDALAREMPEGTVFTRPDGGYQIWVELPYDIDTRDLLVDAARAGVLFAPGSQFLTDGGASRALRLTIAQAGEESIRRGVAALAEVVAASPVRARGGRKAASVHL